MPKLTAEETEKAVIDNQLTLLSLDTNVFHRYKFGLEHGLLVRLAQFAASDVDLVLADIVLRETAAHMVSAVEAADQRLQKAIKDAGSARDLDKKVRTDLFEAIAKGEEPGACVKRRLNDFAERVGLVVAQSSKHVSIDRLVEDYFRHEVPFEAKEEKKREFPDAIALQSLEGYAKSKESMMLVVSQDAGWKAFCATSDWLVCEDELSEAMSRFQKLPSVVAAKFAARIVAGEADALFEEIEQELERFVEAMDVYVEASAGFYYEYYVEEQVFEGFDFRDPPRIVLIDHDEDEELFVFQTSVDVTVTIGCDFSFSVMDEGDEIPVGSHYVSKTDGLKFNLAITLRGDPEGEFYVLAVEVVEHRKYFDFGEVKPDYDELDYDELDYDPPGYDDPR